LDDICKLFGGAAIKGAGAVGASFSRVFPVLPFGDERAPFIEKSVTEVKGRDRITHASPGQGRGCPWIEELDINDKKQTHVTRIALYVIQENRLETGATQEVDHVSVHPVEDALQVLVAAWRQLLPFSVGDDQNRQIFCTKVRGRPFGFRTTSGYCKQEGQKKQKKSSSHWLAFMLY
jgi:hypothetical protein